jgi:hypothetical protein
MPKTLTVADLTDRLGLRPEEAEAVAGWCGESDTWGPVGHGYGWRPVFDEDDIAELTAAWQADAARIARTARD